MSMTFLELSAKEVICTCDGARLGYVNDLELDAAGGRVFAYLLPDRRLFCFSRKPRYRVQTNWVERIGEDLILVGRYQCLEKEKNSKKDC